jgi:hypothetical protein
LAKAPHFSQKAKLFPRKQLFFLTFCKSFITSVYLRFANQHKYSICYTQHHLFQEKISPLGGVFLFLFVFGPKTDRTGKKLRT